MCFLFVAHDKRNHTQNLCASYFTSIFSKSQQNTVKRYYHPNFTYTESKTQRV